MKRYKHLLTTAAVVALTLPASVATAEICKGPGTNDVSGNWNEYDFNVRLRRILPLSSHCDVTGARDCEFRVYIGAGKSTDEAVKAAKYWTVKVNYQEYKKAYEEKKPLIINSSLVPGAPIYSQAWKENHTQVYLKVEEVDAVQNDKLIYTAIDLEREVIFTNPSVRPHCDNKWFVLTHSQEGKQEGKVEHAQFLFTIEAKSRR